MAPLFLGVACQDPVGEVPTAAESAEEAPHSEEGCAAVSPGDSGDPSRPCPEILDEGDAGTIDCEIEWFFDEDDDGVGGQLAGRSCSQLPGTVMLSGDCNDGDQLVYPGNRERIDGVDADCDGAKDWLVQIYVAVDDAGELCINGETLGDTGNWAEGMYYETWMTSGLAAVGIFGWDLGLYITAGIAHLEISDGTVWTSDATWMYSPDPNDESSKVGWCTPYFDDSGWASVQSLGPIGTSPWGAAPSLFPADSPAQWIWDHFPVELNSQYLRTVIELP